MDTTPEFDAFGPWIYEVRTADEVPPLYRAHPIDLEAARMVLKVPRPIERRNATPTMHLYDHLLVAGLDELTVLSRDGDTFGVRSVPYRRIGAAQLSVSLLDGRLRLADATPGSGGELLALAFNGVSLGTVEGLVDLLLEQALVHAGVVGNHEVGPAGPEGAVGPVGTPTGTAHTGTAPTETVPSVGGTPAPSGRWSLGGPDVALIVAYRELAERHPELVRLADHARVPVQRAAMSWVARMLDRWWPVTLHAAVVAAAPGRVEVLHRRELFSVGGKPVHSIARTTLLTSAVTALTLTPHPAYAGALDCRVSVGDAVVRLALPEGAPTVRALRDALAAG
jgi:hypothetical protein